MITLLSPHLTLHSTFLYFSTESAGSEDLTEDPIGYIFALLEELFKALLAIFGR